jgi:hypothetical protein
MEYSDNIKQVLSNIEGKLKKASDVSKLNRTIGTYLQKSNLRRIHNEGRALSGQGIGHYSGKPLYVNPKHSPRQFPTKGKNGQTTFKNGKKHKTAYFNGWKGFRSSIGRETGFVNLQLSGKLLKDWIMEQRGKDFIIGFRSEYGTKISAGNEQHFNKKIWGISQQDYKEIEVIKKDFIKQALA